VSNMKLTFSEVVTRISDYLSLTNNTAPTGDNLTLATDIAMRGYRRFLYPIDMRNGDAYEWSFLKQYFVLPISSLRWQYPLPGNFSMLLTAPEYGDESGLVRLQKIPPEQILAFRTGFVTSFPPSFYSIVPYGAQTTSGEYDEIWFYPLPDAAYELRFWYKVDPLKPSALTEVMVGGVRAAEAIIENCLAIAEQQENEQLGLHTTVAEKLTQALIVTDSKPGSEAFLGNLTDAPNDLIVHHPRGTLNLDNIWLGE